MVDITINDGGYKQTFNLGGGTPPCTSHKPYIIFGLQAYVRKYPSNIWPYMYGYLYFGIGTTLALGNGIPNITILHISKILTSKI